MPIDLIDLMSAKLLAWARLQAHLSLEDAAERLRVPCATLDDWERGATAPSLQDLKRLARTYGRSVGVFFLPQPPLEPSLGQLD